MQARKRRSAAEWSTLVRQWRASGLTTKEFAARHELSAASLYWWRQRLNAGLSNRARAQESTSSLALKDSTTPVRFTEVRVAKRAEVSGQLEVVARSGHVIRVHGEVDPAALRTVLAAVERC
jgi:hypothetical protein